MKLFSSVLEDIKGGDNPASKLHIVEIPGTKVIKFLGMILCTKMWLLSVIVECLFIKEVSISLIAFQT